MVAGNRAALEAAATRAKSIVEKFDLQPAVDVAELLNERATVEFVTWAHQCDAVTSLGHIPPRVFVRSGATPLRERFTLAHELGHIELSWHVGTVDCVPDGRGMEVATPFETAGWTQEREANEFASRLLVPDRWLAPVVKGRTHFTCEEMQEVLEYLSLAKVSALAGVIALCRHLVPGHAIFVGNRFAISNGTPWPGYSPLVQAEVTAYLESSYEHHTFVHQGREVTWALMVPAVELIDTATAVNGATARSPHEVLMDCCKRMFGAEAASRALSINGVVGAATRKKDLGWKIDAIVSTVCARVATRDDLAPILNDEEFILYLQMRAQAIVSKRESS